MFLMAKIDVLLNIRHVAKTNYCETRNNYIQIFVKLVQMQLASFRIIRGSMFIPHYYSKVKINITN